MCHFQNPYPIQNEEIFVFCCCCLLLSGKFNQQCNLWELIGYSFAFKIEFITNMIKYYTEYKMCDVDKYGEQQNRDYTAFEISKHAQLQKFF
jgi:hypothetical protein